MPSFGIPVSSSRIQNLPTPIILKIARKLQNLTGPRLFGDFFVGVLDAPGDIFETFPALRARRALETSVRVLSNFSALFRTVCGWAKL